MLIAIPFYKNEDLVEAVVGSLINCAADLIAINAEAVFYNDSPDYEPLDAALDAILPRAQAAFPCRVVRNAKNLGFVKTMNRAIAEAVERRLDLLLLNSDTIVTPGALTEMVRVASLDAMIAFVNPRSNNATLTTLPVPPERAEHAADAGGFAYGDLAARLPDFSYVPTAVGFCMLIRWAILAEFGGFDEIYGHGYNEENDLVMRASRCGYRAVLANHAFVWHESERSFSTANVSKGEWEPVNRAILDQRYPEYGAYTSAFFQSPEYLAESLLGQLVPDAERRLDLAFDFSSFSAMHNGTFQAGRQLLQAACKDWGDRFNIYVLCAEETFGFHDFGATGAIRRDVHGSDVFAAVFRVGQPYDWNAIQRLVTKAPVVGIYMLDTISIDCTQLTSPLLFNLWQFAMDNSDVVVALSHQTANQLNTRFRIPPHVVQACSLLSTEVADYAMPAPAVRRPVGAPVELLVLGNHFPHKYTAPTANALAEAFPDRSIVALGQTKPRKQAESDPLASKGLEDFENLTGVAVGQLTENELAAYYHKAAAIIFPSHYEGFGIPVLNALACRRPLYVRRLPVFLELWEKLGRNPNIHFYETTGDLIRQLQTVAVWQDAPLPPGRNGADRSAREIRAAIEQALERVEYRRIVDRLRGSQFPGQVILAGGLPTGAPAEWFESPAAFAANFVAVRVERLARVLFGLPLLFSTARLIGRGLRAIGLVRGQ